MRLPFKDIFSSTAIQEQKQAGMVVLASKQLESKRDGDTGNGTSDVDGASEAIGQRLAAQSWTKARNEGQSLYDYLLCMDKDRITERGGGHESERLWLV